MKTNNWFRSGTGVLCFSVLATLLWGSAFPFIKISYQLLDISKNDPFQQLLFAGYRFTLSGAFILLFMKMTGQSVSLIPASAKSLLRLAIVQTFLQYSFLYIGLIRSSSILGSILTGAISLFQIILAHYFFKDDQLNARKIIGIILGFAGIGLLFIKGNSLNHFGFGELFLLGAALSSAMGNILSKVEARSWNVFYLNGYQMLLGGLLLIGISCWRTGLFPFPFHWYAVWILFYLSAVSSVSFVVWNYLLKNNPVGKISMYMFLVPLFGVIWSNLLVNEALHFRMIISLGFVIAGIITVNRRKAAQTSGIYGKSG